LLINIVFFRRLTDKDPTSKKKKKKNGGNSFTLLLEMTKNYKVSHPRFSPGEP